MTQINDLIPSPFYKRHTPLTNEQKKEIFDFLESKTGFKSFVVIMNDEAMPCPEEEKGLVCQGHVGGMISHNISSKYIEGAIEQVLENIKK